MSYIKLTEQFASVYYMQLKIGYEVKSQWGGQRRRWMWRVKGRNDMNIVIMY